MRIMVQKFGGTSVATKERMRQVLGKVRAGLASGCKVIAVLSARSGETNALLALANEWSENPDPAELDQLICTGEQVSVALFAMLLKDEGISARSFTGQQIGISTDEIHGKARIKNIDTGRILAMFGQYDVLVVAGKGHEQYQIVGSTVHFFDDVAEVAAALEAAHV